MWDIDIAILRYHIIDVHSFSKEMQFFKSCISFGEECMRSGPIFIRCAWWEVAVIIERLRYPERNTNVAYIAFVVHVRDLNISSNAGIFFARSTKYYLKPLP